MSDYIARAKNPKTGRFKKAHFIDNYFGRHKYGVQFYEKGKVYPIDEIDIEDFVSNAPAEVIEEAIKKEEADKAFTMKISGEMQVHISDGPSESVVDEAMVIEVIKVCSKTGEGIENDPVRIITEYFSLDGKLLATNDPIDHLVNEVS